MNEIRILSADDFDAFARITVNAYPGMITTSEEKIKEHMLEIHKEPTVAFYGLFRAGQLLGLRLLRHVIRRLASRGRSLGNQTLPQRVFSLS